MDDAAGRLDLDPTSRTAVLEQLQAILSGYFEAVAGLRVVPDPENAKAAVAEVEAIDLQDGQDPLALVDTVAGILQRGIVHTGHPGYMGLFNPASTFLGVVGDAMTAAFNPQLGVVSHAPAAYAIERACLDLLGSRLGLPSASSGQFTSGGSEANLLGMLVGLHRRFPALRDEGLQSLPKPPAFYIASEAHHSFTKLAQATGLGRRAVRMVPVDSHHRLDVDRLAQLITRDRQDGLEPFMVAATAGTTNGGALDPLTAVARLAAAEDLHFHVDAAWAGAVAMSDRHRHLLEGIELADSVTVDAHKWLSAPMGAGVLLTPHGDALRHAFAVDATYMPSAAAVDSYLTGLQWSRRLIGLKVFLGLAGAGRKAFGAEVDRTFTVGDQLRDGLAKDGWRIRNRTPLPIVCFDDPEDSADAASEHLRAIVDAVTASGQAWLSMVTLDDRPAIRACITSYRTDETTIDSVRRLLLAARRHR